MMKIENWYSSVLLLQQDQLKAFQGVPDMQNASVCTSAPPSCQWTMCSNSIFKKKKVVYKSTCTDKDWESSNLWFKDWICARWRKLFKSFFFSLVLFFHLFNDNLYIPLTFPSFIWISIHSVTFGLACLCARPSQKPTVFQPAVRCDCLSHIDLAFLKIWTRPAETDDVL